MSVNDELQDLARKIIQTNPVDGGIIHPEDLAAARWFLQQRISHEDDLQEWLEAFCRDCVPIPDIEDPAVADRVLELRLQRPAMSDGDVTIAL